MINHAGTSGQTGWLKPAVWWRWLLPGLMLAGSLSPEWRASAAEAHANPLVPAAPDAISITEPSGSMALGEAADYAALAWNDPWDMSQPLDVRQADSPTCLFANHFIELTPCPAGTWCSRVRSGVDNPDMLLLHPGLPDALHTGRTGQLKPINANVYTQLSFRMYVEGPISAANPGFQFFWTNGTTADIGGDESRWGQTRFQKIYAGWNIYTIDLTKDNDSTMPGSLLWSGQITGLRFDPGLADMSDKRVDLDWVRLSPPATQQVEWTTGDGGAVAFSLQRGGGPAEPIWIYDIAGSGLAHTVAASSGAFNLPVSLPPGDWYVHLATGASQAGPAGPWNIQAIPTLNFVAPSFTSGDDYAFAVLGEVWDMNQLADIHSHSGLQGNPVISNGELVGTSADQFPDNDCSAQWEDPLIDMVDHSDWDGDPLEPGIDTNRYRYLSFRLKLDGTPDIGYGWVGRVVWADYQFTNCGVTEDVILHAGWNDVRLDLGAAGLLEDYGSLCSSDWNDTSLRRQLRLDPLEVPIPTTFHLDDVKLTAMDSAPTGGAFAVKYLRNAVNAAVAFCYDTDRNPGGCTLMAPFTPPGGPTPGPFAIFLPSVFRHPYPVADPPGTQMFWWDLDGVAPGTYYVSGVLTNANHTTTWYSDTPVNITN